MAKDLWEGNEAIAEAAIRGGVEAYFGYPITPQTELLEYMARRMPEAGARRSCRPRARSPSINMVYGAACGGRARHDLFIQSRHQPDAGGAVLHRRARGARGDRGHHARRARAGQHPAEPGDYFQMTRSAGHGDYHPIVLAPATIQEAVDLTYEAFPLAEKYRTIVILAATARWAR